jgi:mRNA interferase MazF
MTLKFHPEPGTILICDYTTGFREPEMVKRRPVVTISPRLKRRDGLITVVPLSTTPPTPVCDHHCRLTIVPALPEPFDSPEMWVKADMLANVGFARLDLIRTGRDPLGKRKYLTPRLEPAQLKIVYHCVLHAIGLGRLTSGLE